VRSTASDVRTADKGEIVAEYAHRLLPETPIASLDEYLESGGGAGLAAALEMDPGEVISVVTDSGLRGRGGAGFPTGVKWASVREAGTEDPDSVVYLVCNAAEGEPGTYKDRALMSYNPYQVVEGILIGMYAVGAEIAYIAVKKRFTEQIKAIVDAVAAMAADGWWGAERIEISTGPDEYLFGEEKAMMEVIEGKLPLPRLVPPYQTGLFASMQQANPTLVNNVETFANVPLIIDNGADWFREVGTDDTPGTMIYTVTGDVSNPGCYELPTGTSMRTLIEEIAGASDVMAIYAGVALPVMTPEMLDVPLGFDAMEAAGSGMGSGGYVVYDSSHCIVKVLHTLMHFLAVESCGQCVACVLGTENLADRLHKIDAGEGVESDLEALLEQAATVTDQNRCYLPVGAQLMVGSTLEKYAADFTAHLGRPCPVKRQVPVPKIEELDLETGEVVFDPDYHRKQLDWSYEPQ
jgi:NADH-quinone oxidoreductase subunit F